jgi:hypothetical protein
MGRVMATVTRRPYVNTDITDTPLMRVRLMVTMGRAGFPVEYLSEPGRGSGGAFGVEGLDRASAAVGAVVAGADAGLSADADLLVDAASHMVRLAAFTAVADFTVAVGSMAAVASTVVVAAASTVAEVMVAADTGSRRLNRSSAIR